MNKDLVTYYKERSTEYEKIYSKPDRKEDLKTATKILKEIFARKEVLEIACGTGYWSEKIAMSAKSVFATDVNEAVIEIAKQKLYVNGNVIFEIADLYHLKVNNKYESLFGGFIWSHIKLEELESFLSQINNLVLPGGTVVIMDNNFVEGSNHPITETDINGNTFQTRKLENGSEHLVLKNFPDEGFLKNRLSGIGNEIQFFNQEYYWILVYQTKRE